MNNPVGLWMLPAHVGASRSAVAALQRDFARVRALDHPHIVRLHELGSNGQQYYVTGERLDAEPLREVLTHLTPERLDVGEADDVVRAIGSALVYAHEQGVVHGDVRAENVLVTMDRRVLLTNFLARHGAKDAARAPQASDDLVGLARLAAELYTGSSAPHALRSAAHDGVPAPRLNAIRAVLEAPNRRSASVAEFLATAGLGLSSAGVVAYPPLSADVAAPRPSSADVVARRPARRPRSWPLLPQGAPRRSRSPWRLALPVVAVAAIAMFVASYGWRESALELERRGIEGIEALSGVASRVTRPAPAQSNETPEPTAPHAGPSGAAATFAGAPSAPVTVEPPAAVPPDAAAQSATSPSPAPRQAATAVAGSTAVQGGDPPVLALDVARISVREDHLVVAIDIVRSGDTTRETEVGWWTSPGTAHEEDDYVGGRRMVKFPPGSTVERVLIPIVNDTTRESDEVFTVHLGRPHNGVTGRVTATRVTVLDDD